VNAGRQITCTKFGRDETGQKPGASDCRFAQKGFGCVSGLGQERPTSRVVWDPEFGGSRSGTGPELLNFAGPGPEL